MTKQGLLYEANRFRQAIEKAKAAGEFIPQIFKQERMNIFPYDCCDDTADLFTHYLYHEFGIDSIRVDGEYYDNNIGYVFGHSWQETEGWVVDLTGDQFNDNPYVRIKTVPIYVGKTNGFYGQFEIRRQEHSCGIECLGDDCRDRMYDLYDKITRYLE
jgi:hypothetical protein